MEQNRIEYDYNRDRDRAIYVVEGAEALFRY